MVKSLTLVLDNIRSAHNVGAIFRTADAAGVEKIYLIGTTPAPIDRFGRTRPDIQKTALGAEKSVAWEHVSNTEPFLKQLKKEGVTILALEQHEKSKDYKKIKLKGATALIVGNEVEGIPESILKKADHIIEIPMRGKKESLNVSVATGIALFRLLDCD